MSDSFPVHPPVPDFIASRRLALLGARALGALCVLVRNAGQYPPAHPFFLGSAGEFLLAIEAALEGRGEGAFLFAGGECFFAGLPVTIDEASSSVIDGLAGNGIRCILFRSGVTRQEAASFSRLIAGPDSGIVSGSWTDVFLNDQGIRRISLCGGAPEPVRVDVLTDDGLDEAVAVLAGAREAFGRVLGDIRALGQADWRVVREIVAPLAVASARSGNALIAAACLRAEDDYAVAHAVNVAALCLCFGRALSLPPDALSALGQAGLLHDIGKATPGSALDAHPALGALMLSNAEGIEPVCAAAALTHHGGAGPAGEGERRSIPRLSRIVAIADAFEGLTALRVRFGLAMSPLDVARRLFSEAGAGFDQALLKAFLSTVGLFPAGTVLSLDTGELATVVTQGADPFRPLVRMLNGDGSGATVSLALRSQGRYLRSPSCVLPARAGGRS